ncbi:YbaY family lipoprotein [Streptomyces sp. APSN-46.1]|uniref:YbaY family lipoprotein n=1 Tax=Streptomyces sp. APSN-46.1 TaxID=2929049 RepID=UPI001FB39A40|nr:YbaY family lipoprotein [Streptomyces sp. APSN-46.1]MCJ1676460.1 YbaY family lipoprotein [Streptomyces sp. APSN-46.1]
MTHTVTGFVSLPPDAPAGRAATVLVEVRDVSRADAPSTVIGSQVQTGVELTPGGRIPFGVELPDLGPGGAYQIRAHVDVSGTGTVEHGDLMSTQATPVPADFARPVIAPVAVV